MRKPIQLILILSFFAVLSACQRDRPASTPPPAPAVDATLTPVAEATLAVAPSATMPMTVTAPLSPATAITTTATVTPTAALEAVALQALRIRGGPGLEYPIVGDLAETGRVVVIGRSADGVWLQIECPPGVASQPCWIIGDPDFWQFDEVAAALPTAPAPPVPAPSPTPTAPPCVISPPAGWVAYTVMGGDTLSDLAGRFGASVVQLQRVNCLNSDVIGTGGSLWVPGGAAAPAGASTSMGAPESGSSAPDTTLLSQAAVSSIVFKEPARISADCWNNEFTSEDPSQDLTIDISGEIDFDFREAFVVTDWVCVFVNNRDPNQPVDVRLIRPRQPDLQLNEPSETSNAWSFLLTPGTALLPGETSATWTVLASEQAGRDADPRQITVSRARSPLLRVTTRSVAAGGKVEAAAAGFAPNGRTPLYLYRLHTMGDQQRWQLERALPDLVSDASGEATYAVTMRLQDAGSCFLLHTGEADPNGASKVDPRVFAVGISPKDCQ